MIDKIEIKQLNFGEDETLINIDITNNQLTYIKNNNILKNEKYYLNKKNATELIKEYITYWDKEYINNTIIDGIKTEIIIYIDNEIIKYNFINKIPPNYNEFMIKLQRMVNTIW